MADDVDAPLTLDAMLRLTARLHGEVTAYVDCGPPAASVTWGELSQRVQDAAAGLVALGLQHGDRVAICAENGIDWLLAYHAIVAAGGVGVLVYFDLKPPEIREQVRRPESRFLVALAGVLSRLGDDVGGVERVLLAGPSSVESALHVGALAVMATAESRDALARHAPAPDDGVAMIYTSGTSGGAKGVKLSHRNFLTDARAAHAALDFGPTDRILLVLPLHHAMPFIAAVVLACVVGAGFVIENDLRRVRDRLQEHHPTIFFGVPALYEIVYRNLLARAEAEGRLETLLAWQARLRRVKALTGVNLAPVLFRPIHHALGGRLRFLVSGGAALSPQTARDFFSLGLPLIQGWGMTEAGPAVAVQRFSSRRFRTTPYYERHAGSVGPVLPGMEVRLIDVPEKGIRVATSGEGEVIVRGPNVFQGYWQAEDATREALVDGWLRTGDLARIERDGSIYLTGRSKYIIVLESGEKVHPDELEDNLARSELISDICIVGRRERDRTQVAAVVYPEPEAVQRRLASTGDAVDEASLRRVVGAEVERLGRELAQYKRVSRVELADGPLPKTPLQKMPAGASSRPTTSTSRAGCARSLTCRMRSDV